MSSMRVNRLFVTKYLSKIHDILETNKQREDYIS
jgi:hypothetical protein